MTEPADIGVVGLGVMGANLALNLAERGFRVAVFDRDPKKAQNLGTGPMADRLVACASEQGLVDAIQPPAALLLSVPAGEATDTAIASLLPHLRSNAVLIDAGNADFHDTSRRSAEIAASGVHFIGMGVSGGAEGARHGPALMAGGPKAAWDRVAPMLTAIAARHVGEACAGRVGPDGAGHFVKTVHNGIEYADMQMIAEVYGVLRDGLGYDHPSIGAVFGTWAGGPLSSYLIDIAGEVSATRDPKTGAPILDVIVDRAGQKGTGRWTVIEAYRLGAVASTIEAAVTARTISADNGLRGAMTGSKTLPVEIGTDTLHDALHAGKIISYAQGFALLQQASEEYGWALNRADVARLWRAGCIIRAAMLDDIAEAFDAEQDAHLLTAPGMLSRLAPRIAALREVVYQCIAAGLAVPALSAALSYVDQAAQPRGTANMIQGLRDRFGSHGFERTDAPGTGHHGPWAENAGR